MPYAVSFCVRTPRNAPGRNGTRPQSRAAQAERSRVFRNPITLIWESIQWATDQVKLLRLHDQNATGS
jgi:hypothetical protein